MNNRHKPKLSLLTAYRNRQAELEFLLSYLSALRNDEGFTDFELVLVEGTERAMADSAVGQHAWVKYQHLPMENPRRSRLLNCAAEIAEGDFLMAYKIDLLPGKGVLRHHLALASATPRCLVAGYRLRLPERPDSPHSLPAVNELIEKSISLNRSLAFAEDTKPGLLRSLLTTERYAMGCCYPRRAFEAAGGFNEDAEGREEQDLIERVCKAGLTLVRSYDLIYFQLPD